jgi:hypothetical protein
MLRDIRGQSERKAQVESRGDHAEMIALPQGRVLTVVVDEKAVFVGENPIAFEMFGEFLRENREKLSPDYVMVFGTDLVRYGKVVEVYAAMHKVWMVPQQIVTRSVTIGTRYPAIKVCEHYWDYDAEEEEEMNQSAQTAPGLRASVSD